MFEDLRKPSATLHLGALGDLLLGHFPAALPQKHGGLESYLRSDENS